MKASFLALLALCVSKLSGEGVELVVSSSASPEDRIEEINPEATSFYLIFQNDTKQTYYVLKPVNFSGFSHYRIGIRANNGKRRALYASMTSCETAGSAPQPLEIAPGNFGAIEMFLYPQRDARGWNYTHTWSFQGFEPDDSELIVSYSYTKDAAPFDWMSYYRLKGSSEIDVSSKPIKIRFRQDKSKKAEQDGAGQPATRSESDSEGGGKPQPESEGRSR